MQCRDGRVGRLERCTPLLPAFRELPQGRSDPMRARLLVVAAAVVFCALNVSAGPVMFGGLGGHGPNSDSTNDGALVTINQTTGDVSVVGHPNGVARLTGIAFDSGGALFGST